MRRSLLSRGGPELSALLVLLAVWWLATSVLGIKPFLLPSPPAVWDAVVAATASGELPTHLLATLSNLAAGFGLGALLGLSLGVVLAKTPRLERALNGPILFLQIAPKIALAPLFLIWFGLGVGSKLALIISLVVFPIMVSTLTGLRSVDRRLGELGRILRLSPWTQFRRIDGPAALPEIFVGLRLGAVQAVVGVILAEWMSGQRGLGYVMTYASSTYRTPLLFGAVLLTVALGLAVYGLIETVERRLLSWRDA